MLYTEYYKDPSILRGRFTMSTRQPPPIAMLTLALQTIPESNCSLDSDVPWLSSAARQRMVL